MPTPPAFLREYDTWTGALSRNSLFQYLPQLIAYALQNQKDLFLCSINIDNMKRFNMHNGHVLGDVLLNDFVVRVTPMLREHQHLFRYGGDWFVITSINHTSNDVVALALQICRDARMHLAPPQPDLCGDRHCLGPASISASIGIAQLKPDMTLNELFFVAEEQLHKAKLAGRNCMFIGDQHYVEAVDMR